MVDVLVAGIALAFIGPVMLLLAAAVRLTSRGPAFYRQVRVGRSGEHFTIMKLRSMVSGADRAGPLVTTAGTPASPRSVPCCGRPSWMSCRS